MVIIILFSSTCMYPPSSSLITAKINYRVVFIFLCQRQLSILQGEIIQCYFQEKESIALMLKLVHR